MFPITKRAALTIGAVAVTLTAPTAHATPAPQAHDHVTCFIKAIGPFKDGYGSTAPIGYGFKVHCVPHGPMARGITTTLWRKDLSTGKIYKHSDRYDNSRDADKEITYYASCSNASIQYEFHTQAYMDGYNGNFDPVSDDSDSVLLDC